MKIPDADTVATLLAVVADLLRGDRHSRRTIAAATGKSLATADRWIEQIEATLPNTRRVREGKTTWLVHDGRRVVPTRSAAVGACVAASLGAIFEGSEQERNLKDARDYILKERGDPYAELDRKFVLAPRGGESALPEAGSSLNEVVEALLLNNRLRFDYTHNDGGKETVELCPLSLVLYDHQFYLVAHRDSGFYPYRFARMGRVDRLPQPFAYPTKGEYDPRSILLQGFGIHMHHTGPVEDIEVLLTEPWASYALKHRWHPSQRIERREGSVCVMLQVRLCREVETWVLGFGECATVVKPQRLRDQLTLRLRQALGNYESSQAGPSVAKARIPDDRLHSTAK